MLDARNLRCIVDLASNEPLPHLPPRHCLLPVSPRTDGVPESEPWLLLSAIQDRGQLARSWKFRQQVSCSAGLSRGPAIVAAALSTTTLQTPEDCLRQVSHSVSHDVSPGFWNEVAGVCRTLHQTLPAV